MKGYKILGKDMSAIWGDGMVYELGVWYEIPQERPISVFQTGYHFCKTVHELQDSSYGTREMGNPTDVRTFEVEADGDMDSAFDIYCARRIRLVRELSESEIRQQVKYHLDEIFQHPSENVRKYPVRFGLGLDELTKDDSWEVRAEVARYGHNLKTLVKDSHPFVRRLVAKRGYGMDRLLRDKSVVVREEIAAQGYGLEVLVKDASHEVRAAVARQGYGLDILRNDSSPLVRESVERFLKKQQQEEAELA